MEYKILTDICEYLINNKGLDWKKSKSMIHVIVFLSFYGKKRIENMEIEVCAKMNGPYIPKLTDIYKSNIFSNKKKILSDNIKNIIDEYYDLVSKEAYEIKILSSSCHSVYFYHCYMKEDTKYNTHNCYIEADRLEELLKYDISSEWFFLECFRNLKIKEGENEYLYYTHKQLFLLREDDFSLENYYMITDQFIPLDLTMYVE